MLPPDLDNPCRHPENRAKFDAVLDLSDSVTAGSKYALRVIDTARGVCNGHPDAGIDPCPYRLACLDASGGEPGVWAGLTLGERVALGYGGAA